MVGIRHLPCRLPISRRALTGLDAVAEPPTSPSPFLGVEGEVRRGLALCLAHSDPPGRCQLLLQLLSVLLSQLPHLLHHPQAASCQRCDLEGRKRWELGAMECGGHCHPWPGLERHPAALRSLPRSLWATIPTHHGIHCLEPECPHSLWDCENYCHLSI